MMKRQIQKVRERAREQAKDIDKFAACCSDGEFEYARTTDVATDILDGMRARHESRRPDVDFEYDVIDLTAGGKAQ